MEETNLNQPISTDPVGFPGASQMQPQGSSKNWKWLLLLILFLVVIGAVTFFVFKSSKTSSGSESPSPTASSDLSNIPTTEPTSTPNASPSDKTQVKIQVLKGTGVGGEASFIANQLKSLGYTSVTTGNATTQNATDTLVTFSPTVGQDVVTEITAKLKDVYTNVTTNSSTVDGADIQITTG